MSLWRRIAARGRSSSFIEGGHRLLATTTSTTVVDKKRAWFYHQQQHRSLRRRRQKQQQMKQTTILSFEEGDSYPPLLHLFCPRTGRCWALIRAAIAKWFANSKALKPLLKLKSTRLSWPEFVESTRGGRRIPARPMSKSPLSLLKSRTWRNI